MLAVYIGAYVFMLAILWGFFLIARHHSYKFKHFSGNIVPITNILFFFLLILSILGFVFIFFLDADGRSVKIDSEKKIIENYY